MQDKLIQNELLTAHQVANQVAALPAVVQPRPIDELHQDILSGLPGYHAHLIPDSIGFVRDAISVLRENAADHVLNDGGRKTFLNHNNSDNPIDRLAVASTQSEEQALRYLQGALIIAGNIADNGALKRAVWKAFSEHAGALQSSKATKSLANKFASLLAGHGVASSLSNGHKHLTMARDLAIMTDPNRPDVSTISEDDTKLSVEHSRPYKVSESYYHHDFMQPAALCENAKQFAGCQKRDDTWLDHYFVQENVNLLKAVGSPAPPSARWMPVPGNVSFERSVVFDDKHNLNMDKAVEFDFVRLGTPCPFDIGSKAQQEKVARAILKEVILGAAKRQLEIFKSTYGDFAKGQTFFVDYQSLLSPHIWDLLGAKDNNKRFVDVAKAVMDDPNFQSDVIGEIKKLSEAQDVNVKLTQTNTSVNNMTGSVVRGGSGAFKKGGYKSLTIVFGHKGLLSYANKEQHAFDAKFGALADMLSNVIKKSGFNEWDLMYSDLQKLEEFLRAPQESVSFELSTDAHFFIHNILKSGSHEFHGLDENEQPLSAKGQRNFAVRLQAGLALRNLLNDCEPYSSMQPYQRNIMKASLEALMQGSQSLTFIGCKSARDRTEVTKAAMKSMQEDPQAMSDWAILNKGIIKSLKQGHGMQAMRWHVATLKIGAVHSGFKKALSPAARKMIKYQKPFSKKLTTEKVLNAQALGELRSDSSIAEALSNPSQASAAQGQRHSAKVVPSASLATDKQLSVVKLSWGARIWQFFSSLFSRSSSKVAVDHPVAVHNSREPVAISHDDGPASAA